MLISVLILPVSLLWAALYLAFGSPVGWVPLGVLRGPAGVHRRLLTHAELRPVPLRRPGGDPVRSDSVDGAARGLPRLRRSRSVGNPRPARSARVQRRPSRESLVRRVGRRVPRLGHRRRAAGRRVAGCSRVVHEHDARPERHGRRHDRLHAAGRRSPASAATRSRRCERSSARSESLLLNILPRSIADRLKAETQTIADQFSSASILFADVVDFTPLAERLPPAEVVGVLDHLFSHFDVLAERHELEKIKTIGDCYMVAAGVPSPRPDHAHALALMALDMQAAMRLGRRGRASRARAARRNQLGTGHRRRDRPEAVPLRPLGRRGEHREPHGVPRNVGADPDHACNEGAARGRVRLRAARNDPDQGQRRDRGLVSRRSPA